MKYFNVKLKARILPKIKAAPAVLDSVFPGRVSTLVVHILTADLVTGLTETMVPQLVKVTV